MRFYVLVALYLSMMTWFIYSVYQLGLTVIYAENGVLETMQAFILMISCVVFLLPTINQNRNDKLILLFFSWLCFSFVLREVDVEDFDLPHFIVMFGAGIGRNIVLAVGLLAISIYGFCHFSYYLRLARRLILSKEGVLILGAGCLLQAGSFFESADSLSHHVLWEELLELTGYCALLFSAMLLSQGIISKRFR